MRDRFFHPTQEIGKNKLPFFLPQEYPSIVDGYFDYNIAFKSFIEGTHQKEDTAIVVGLFTSKLQQSDILSTKNEPLYIADIGCSDSTTSLRYLDKMDMRAKFSYTGIDTNEESLRKASNLLSLNPKIANFTLVHGDALAGNLSDKIEFEDKYFDFIFISHTAYYVKNHLISCFLIDISNLLSKKQGIAVFFHEDSTHYFRATYNPSHFNLTSTPTLLEQSANTFKKENEIFNKICFTSKLRFKCLTPELWRALKKPLEYRKYAHDTDFVDTLEKLAFIVQSDLTTLAKAGALERYIDDIKAIIDSNDNCLDLKTHMQVLVSSDYPFRHTLAKLLRELEKEIPTEINNIINKESHSLSSWSLP